jgi:hypothetical protein
MYKCLTMSTPIVKGDKLGAFQSPRNHLGIGQMKLIPYALAARSITHLSLGCLADFNLTQK